MPDQPKKPEPQWTDDDRDIRNFLGLAAITLYGAVIVPLLLNQNMNRLVEFAGLPVLRIERPSPILHRAAGCQMPKVFLGSVRRGSQGEEGQG